MSIQIVEIEFDWTLPVDPASDGTHDVAGVIRRAVSEPYERRKWLDSDEPDNVVFILDRRVNWYNFPKTRKQCLSELGKSERARRNPNSFQWAVAAEKYEHRIYPIPGVGRDSGRLEPKVVLANAQASELEMMVSDPSVLFHHSRAAYFLLPSGEISDYFLRVGNIQKDFQHLKILSYWSLPHLKNVDHVLSESWTISTTVAYMSQFLGQYDPDIKCEWSYLERYLSDDGGDLQHILNLSSSRKVLGPNVLLVVSASASGQLIRRFDRIVHGDPNSSKFRRLVLFALKDQRRNVPVLHTLTNFLEGLELLGAPPHCGIGDAELIEIDKSTYIPIYRTTKLVNFNIVDDTKDAKKFFHKYSGNGIFSVSRRGKSSRTYLGRHHSFHVDILKLMNHPHFHQSLSHVLNEIGTIDAIIYVASEANEKFLNVIQYVRQREKYDDHDILISVDSFTNLSANDEVYKILTNENLSVVMLESIFITGGNLAELSPEIRKIMDSGVRGSAQITYLVGLYRPYSFTKIQWSKSTFSKASNHSGFRGCMKCVEEVLFPLPAAEDCPWQRELRAHDSAIKCAKLEADEEIFLLERSDRIRNSLVSGLRGRDVFFEVPGRGEFSFSSGSFFLDTSLVIESNKRVGVDVTHDSIDEADLVCAVASAMQYWRCRASTDRVFVKEVPFDNVVNLEVVIDNNSFNDSMLRAAIWRALRPGEAVLKRTDSDTRSFLVRVLCNSADDSSDGLLAGEAALAFSAQIRPAIGDEMFDKISWEYLKEFLHSIDGRSEDHSIGSNSYAANGLREHRIHVRILSLFRRGLSRFLFFLLRGGNYGWKLWRRWTRVR